MCWALSITVPGATYLELFLHSLPGHLPFRATHVHILEMRKPRHRQKVISWDESGIWLQTLDSQTRRRRSGLMHPGQGANGSTD